MWKQADLMILFVCPQFGLPTVDTLLRGTDLYIWMVILYIGDMFFNLIIAEKSWHLVRVDITRVFEE